MCVILSAIASLAPDGCGTVDRAPGSLGAVSDLVIRSARPGDLDAIYEICLRTSDAGDDATALHADPLLPGHVWAGAYPVLEPDLAFVLVDADDAPIGYVLGALDTVAFEQLAEREWWPTLRERYPLGAGDTEADRAMVTLIHRPPRADPDVARRYPSHLHIDLLPAAQGRGAGRRLVETLVEGLATAGSTGLHLGVDARNRRAIGFYEAVGFEVIARPEGAVTFGRPL
jgi:ribosomal protein S18 acetylase RimI-like enzyme